MGRVFLSACTCVQTKVIIIINSRAWKKKRGGGGLFCHSEMTLSSHLALIYLTTSTCVKTFPSFINLTFKCILFHPCNICGEAFQRERADIPHYALFFFFFPFFPPSKWTLGVFFQPVTRPRARLELNVSLLLRSLCCRLNFMSCYMQSCDS